MSSIVHSISAIQAVLRHGLTPKTDNEAALLELGFERASPSVENGYDSTLWERSCEHSHRAADGSRLFVRQRAILCVEENTEAAV